MRIYSLEASGICDQENQVHPRSILRSNRQICICELVRVPEQGNDILERLIERYVVVQRPLPCVPGAVDEQFVSLVCDWCKVDWWEWHNSCVVEEGDVCSGPDAGIANEWFRDVDFLPIDVG